MNKERKKECEGETHTRSHNFHQLTPYVYCTLTSPRPDHVQQLFPVVVKGRHGSLVAQQAVLMDEVGAQV